MDPSSMAAPVVPGLIVNELLDKNNYKDWKVWVRTYLQAKGLWSVIEEATGPPPKGKDKREDWMKRNAEALHAIHLCCGKDAFKVIRKEKFAYEAWGTLRSRFKYSGDLQRDHDAQAKEVGEANELKEADEGDLQRDHDAQAKEVGEANELKEAGEGDLQRDHDAQAKEVGEANELKEADEGDGDESSGNNDDTDYDYEPLFRAAKHSKWDSVMNFLRKHPEAVTETNLKDDEKTVLHYAVDDKKLDIVQQLMPFIKDEDELDICDSEWNTALEYCYMLPDTDEMVEIAKCLVQKKKELNAGSDYSFRSILLEAFMKGRPKLANYLFKVTHFETDDPLAAQLISLSFSTKRFDIACKLIQQNPSLAIAKDFFGNSPLNELACTPSTFLSGSRLKFWEKWIYDAISINSTVKSGEGRPNKGDVPTEANVKGKPGEGKGKCAQAHHIVIDIWTSKVDKVTAIFQGPKIENICKFLGIHYIYKMKVNHTRVHEILVCMCQELTTKKQKGGWDEKQTEFVEAAMFQAAERGLVEFLIEILKVNPKLATISNKKGQNLFQVAVEYRQAEVFNLIHGFNKDNRKACMSMADDDDNNMLHMMGIRSPFSQTNRIRGAALQMQFEFQWFKELEPMASMKDLEAENDIGMTSREFFSKNHIELAKEGEKSMKETASACTVVGALIVTMMFAAAFTLPTPLEGNGTPPLQYRRAFRVFIIADSIALFTSTTSVVLFLGILTSRYAEDDILRSLPQKMILGLLTLFLSVVAMVIVFASALFIILPSDIRIALPATLLAGFPIASFIWMQLPFLVEIFYSTYVRTRLFDKEVRVKLDIGKVRW